MKNVEIQKKLLKNLETDCLYFLRNPEELSELLQKYDKQFYHYSLRNLIIANQECKARFQKNMEQLGSYKKWEKVGRSVKKGEKAIWITAPNMIKDKEKDETKIIGFRAVPVFDISQTEGKDLYFDDKNIENKSELTFKDFTAKVKQEIIFTKNVNEKGATDGNKIWISENQTDNQKICTLIHELAHIELNHKNTKLTANMKEFEAESVAYIVSNMFHIENKGCKDYILNWNRKNDLEKIFKDDASKIIQTASKLYNKLNN